MSKFKPNQDSLTVVKPRPSKPAAIRPATQTGERVAALSDPEPRTGVGQPSLEEEGETTLLERLGFGAALLFVFLRFSYLHEFLSSKWGLNLHLIIVLGCLSYLACILSGRLGVAFRNKITWFWIGFACVMGLATVASYWRGGSFPFTVAFVDSALPIVVVLPAVVRTRKQVSQMISTIGVACIVIVLLGALNNDFKAGRMNIDAAGSDIQDPNDYAAHVILMLPALAYLTLRPGCSVFSKGIGIVFITGGLALVLSTGSRGGLTSLALTALFVFFVGSPRVKAILVIGIPILALAAIPFIPGAALSRLGTLFSGDAPQGSEAAESSEQRLALLQESIRISFEHPLLGVGPGVFMDYQADQAKHGGGRGLWHVTHNSYTEVSSECGLIALAFYASALLFTYRSLRRSAKAGSTEAAFMVVMQVGFGICMLFLSMAYNIHMLVLSGLAIALQNRLLLPVQKDDRTSDSSPLVTRTPVPA